MGEKNQYGWEEKDIKIHYTQAGILGFIPFAQRAANKHAFTTALILAIISRETSMMRRYIDHTGDNGHGHGPMQIDDGSFPEFCASDDWKDPEKAIMKGAEVLAQKREEAWKLAPDATDNDFLRIMIAGYNGGTKHAAEHFHAGHDIDRGTTNHNYSADVVARMAIFASLLKGDNLGL